MKGNGARSMNLPHSWAEGERECADEAKGQ